VYGEDLICIKIQIRFNLSVPGAIVHDCIHGAVVTLSSVCASQGICKATTPGFIPHTILRYDEKSR
jgi:hypothetical protein